MLNILMRVALGIIFGGLGFYFISNLTEFQNTDLNRAVSIGALLAFGLAGIFLVPVVTEWIRVWSGTFARRVASEVTNQLQIPKFRGPKIKRDSNNKYPNPIVVDTSALIDGRVADVVESGFLFGTLIVPNFVLIELQNIADASDSIRRGKGRRGFSVLEELKKSKLAKVIIYEENEAGKNVDENIIRLAKKIKAAILTTDFNLNKVASVRGVRILNINSLANAVKTALVPGEKISIKIIQAGKGKNQGVGYLPDGTMIVVEETADRIGETVEADVSRVLQTAAGRMLFAQIKGTKTLGIEAK